MARITKREQLTRISEVLTNTGAPVDLVEFVDGEIALLDKRANSPRKPTKTQRENAALKQRIFGDIAISDAPVTATHVAKAEDITVQKASALIRQLVLEGLVIRETNGKGVTFRVAE